MTESEIQDIVVRVLDEIRSDSVTIEELLHTNVLKGEDLVELNKGRRTSLLDIKEYLDQNEERCIEVLKKGDKDLPTDNNVFSALRTLTEIANNNEVYKKIFLRKDQPEVAEYLLTLLDGVRVGEYVAGKSGAAIGENGNAEFRKLVIDSLRIGDGLIEWDPEYDILRISKSDGSPAGIAASGGLSAKGYSSGSGGGTGGASALYQLVDVIVNSTGTGVEGAVDGAILKYDALADKWKAGEAGLNENELAAYLSKNNYAKKTDIPSLTGYATEKWVTDKGYLVATASDKANWNAAYGWGNHALFGYAKQADLNTVSDKLNSFLSGESISDTIDNWKEFQKVFENFPDSANMVELLRGKVDITTSVKAGTGLIGGGPLSKDITLSLGETGVSVGAYTKLTVDKYGRVTSGTSLIASDIPSLAISKITGLQDALNSKLNSNDFQSKFDAAIAAWFVRDTDNRGIRPALYKGEEVGFYSNTYLSAKGLSIGSGGGGGTSALYQLLDVIPNASSTGVEGAVDKSVLTFDGATQKWKAAPGLDETALAAYLSTNRYATQSWVSSQGYLTQHQSLANYVTLNTAQEITGAKTFFSDNGNVRTIINGRDIITVHNSNFVGGWTRGLIFRKADGTTNYGTFGAYGSGQALNYLYIGQNYASPWITFNDTLVKSNIAFEASTIRKTGGTSAQFLKADGSVDNSTYLTTGVATYTYVKLAGDEMTGALSVPNLTISNTSAVKHIAFSRPDYNYITSPANSFISFVTGGREISSVNSVLTIATTAIHPGLNNEILNGTSNLRWKGIYSVLGDFSGVITAGSSINAKGEIKTDTNITAGTYIRSAAGWFQNDVAQTGLFNKAGDARWFWNGSYWYADKSIYSISDIYGNVLRSRVNTGTAPLIVSSSTMVTNLNSNYVEGLNSEMLFRKKRIGSRPDYERYVILLFSLDTITSQRVDGYFFTTQGGGSRYYRTDVSIWHCRWDATNTGHDGTYSCINKNYQQGGLRLVTVTYQGKEWVAMDSADTSVQAKEMYFFGDWTNNISFTLISYYNTNTQVVLNAEIKDSIKDLASKNILVGTNTVAYLSSNVASATKLQTARTLWGQSFDGTANVTGELKSVTRVSNVSGSQLFLGNSDGTGFVQTSNMCASTGTTYWSLRTTGVGHLRRLNLGVEGENDNTNYALTISGNQYIKGSIVSSYFRVNYDSGNPYYNLTKDSKTAYFQLYDTKAYFGFGTANSLNITQDGKVGIGIGTTNPSYNLHVGGTGYFSGSITTSGNIATGGQDGAFVRVGNVYLQYDATNNAIKVVKYDGTSANLYATGGLSAQGYAPGSGGGGGGGLIQNVYGYTDLGKTYSNVDLNNTFNAYTINQLASRITSLEGGSAMTFNTTGTGEFFSAVSKNGTTVTFTKSTPNYIKSSTTERGVKPNATGNGLLKLYFLSGSDLSFGSGYYDSLFLNSYVDNSGGGSNLITFSKKTGEMAIHYQAFDATEWGTRRIVLESSNYTNYTVSKTGGGASGTWGINITGNANSATSLQNIRTIGISGGATGSPTSFNGTSNITIPVTKIDPSKSHYENTVEKILIKKIVAQYSNDSSEVQGIIKISLPASWSTTMMGIEIDIYDYSSIGYSKVLVGGYNYTTPGWYQTSVSILGNNYYQVRLGYDGSKCCILLGSTTHVWHYPKVVVRNVMSAFSGYMALDGEWSTSVITSEAGLSSLVEPIVNKAMTVGTSRDCSGNAATSSKWATARSISLTGAITGSVSLDGSTNVSLATTFTNSVFDARYVKKAGDTMTGALTVPNLVISGTENVMHLTFSRNSYNYITSPESSYIAFVTGGKTANANTADFIITNNGIYSGGNGVVTNGTNAHRWANVFSVLGNFSGAINCSDINATGNVIATTYKAGKSMFQDGQLELSGATPYIDFHYGSSTVDYTHRIIAETSDRLNITTGLQVNGVLYGKDNLNIGSTIVSNVEPTGTNTWSNLSTLSPVLSMGSYIVAKDSIQPMFRWANTIPEGYITRYIIGSHRPSSSGFGQLRLWVGNNDAGTTGNWFSLNNNGVVSTSTTYFETSNIGFKTGNVVFRANGSVAEISSGTNHLVVSGYSDIHVNYTASGTGRAIPTKWYWHKGAANTWADFEIGLLTTHASAHLGGDVTITDDLNVSGSTTFAGHVIAGMGLDVIDLAYLQDDLQVDGYSSFNSDVTINANLGMLGNIDLNGTIRGSSTSKIICDGVGISAGNKESGCIISGNPNVWNIAFDHNDIQARNNGSWSVLYINDYGGDVSITNASSAYSCKILSTKAATNYNTGALIVSGGIGVGGTVYANGNIIANGAVSARSASDLRLKTNFDRSIRYDEKLLSLGFVLDYNYNDLALQRGEGGVDGNRHTGLIYQNVEKIMPHITYKSADGYGSINYISPDLIATIAGATQLNTLGLRSVVRNAASLEKRISLLEKENEKLKSEIKRLGGRI